MAILVGTPGSIAWVEELLNIGAPEARFSLKGCEVAPSALVATTLNTCWPALAAAVGVPEITPVMGSSDRPAGNPPLVTIARLSML